MQKNMQKKLILLIVTAAFVMTIMGAVSADSPTDLSLTVNTTTVNVGESVLLTSRLEIGGTSNGINGQTIHFFVDGSEIGTNTTQGGGSNTGTATFIYTPLSAGVKQIQARYYGYPDPVPGPPDDGWLPSNSTNRTVTVNAPVNNAVLTIDKHTDKYDYNVGETVTYSFDVTNTGPSAATNVVVVDPLPAGLTYVPGSATYGGVWDSTTRTVTWTLANLAVGGTFNPSFTATVNPGTQGSFFENTATATNNQGCRVMDTRGININEAVLTIDKNTDKTRYNVGETVTYSFDVTNTGPDAATGVVVVDPLPAGLTFVSATNGGVWNPATRIITWMVGDLASGAHFTPTVNATVDAGTQGSFFENTATADNDQMDKPAQDTSGINVNNAVLSIVKSVVPTSYNVGDSVVYNLLVTNTGPDAATNVVVVDPLPAGLTYVPGSATYGGVYDAATRTVTWTLANLAVSGTFNPSFTVTVDAGTQGQTIANTASANNTQNPTPVNSNTVNINVNNAPLSITKIVDRDPAVYNVGETVTYTIDVSNGVEVDPATGVVVTDTLPAGLTFVSATNGGVYDAATRTITWTVGDLASGAHFNAAVTATVTSDAAAKTLVNTATTDNDQMEDPVSATASIYVPSADLVLTKTVDKATPMVKDTVIFTLIVNNYGPDTAVNVTVHDKLPAGLTYVSHTANFGTYDPASGLWTIASLPNGASAIMTITAVVEQSGQIINMANVTALTWDPNLEGNTASAAMNVQEQPEPEPVHGKTVEMQKTGASFGALIVALLMLVAGMVLPRRK